jgi:dienelactone hydrolase
MFTCVVTMAVWAVGLVAPLQPESGEAAPPTRLPAACDPADPESCLYTSDLSFDVGVVEGVSLIDADRSDYVIPLVIRYPVLDTVEPRPVVIWNHGGAPSRQGATRSEEWGNLLAAAGYVVVHPSRLPINDPTPLLGECEANGIVDPDQCSHFVAQLLYGPQTTHFLIEHLVDVAALDTALAGLLDRERIVVAGHSAGSTVALANAGARQQFVDGGPIYDERDEIPLAFLATGVQGPMYAGFQSGFQPAEVTTGSALHSFAGIDRPFMFITGIGDETGEPPRAGPPHGSPLRAPATCTCRGTPIAAPSTRRWTSTSATAPCVPTIAVGSVRLDSPSSTPSSAYDPKPGSGSTRTPTRCSPAEPSSSTTADLRDPMTDGTWCPLRSPSPRE